MILTGSDLAGLKSSLEIWEIVEYVSAAIVIIGVVGEYVAEFTKFAEMRGIEKKLAKISTLVLIIGLVGDLLGLVKTSQLSGRLVASLEVQSGQANAEAAKANESAAKLNERAQALAGEVAILQKEAADARAAQQRVETELAEQQERAANAEKALLELQEQRRPRALTAQQRSDFTAALRVSQPSEKIEIGCAVGIEEACDFAHQFLTLFREAQWPIEYDRINRMTTSTPTNGIVFFKRGEPMQNSPLWNVDTTPTLDILKRAFAAININAKIIAHTTLEKDRIQIYVGGKP